MCGIVGIVDFRQRPVQESSIKKMTDAIKHRGPDGQGQWVDGNVGLGHRRLSIIDLSASASQPMRSEDGRYTLVFNGEIYNYRELAQELTLSGHVLTTNSDTEVLMKSLAVWGKDAILKFNGMFAFAFHDSVKSKLMLARDRYGVKPLYYTSRDSYLHFASEAKAIKVLENTYSEVDKSALVEYMTFQNIFTDRTLDKNIKLLPAGTYLETQTDDTGKFTLVRYWDYHFAKPENKIDDEEYVEELDRLFKQAVKRQLISDVEVGSYLSGGMDSGSISAIAAKEIPNMKTFTIGFDLSSASGLELGFDERSKAKSMSTFFKTEHFESLLKAGDMERSLQSVVWHLEEPRVGQSYPNYYAAKLASKSVKVVLSGTGGDELFGGYPWRYYRGAGSRTFEEYIDDYYVYWQRLVDNTTLNKMLSPISSEISDVWTKDIFRDVFLNHENSLETPEDYVNHSLYFEAKTFLHSLFIVEDKLSMAHGLETRVPFMDNDLVEFAMKLPVHLRIRNLNSAIRINENEQANKKAKYFEKTNDGKNLLRKTMSGYIPSSVSNDIKQGFSSPDASWFRGESIDFVKRKLLNRNNSLYNYLNFDVVSDLLETHFSGLQNKRLLIWSLLSLNEIL